jgi:hypothetical protein
MRRPLVQPLVLAVLLATGTGASTAQTISWNPRSGDVWVDTWLSDVNRYGTRYRDPFVDEMVRYHGAPRDLVTELLGTRNWAPGDVYYACAMARIIGRPCEYVADYWQQHHGQGWGVVAQRLGIRPGSAEFHRLKNGFVPTYDRWGRPIQLDADLQRAYPNRGKGASKAGAARVQGAERAPKGKPVTAPAREQQKGPPAGKGKPSNPGAQKAGPDRGDAARGAQKAARDKANAKPG